MIPPTPKHMDKAERRIRIAALKEISFASIIEKAKAEQRTEAPHQNEGSVE